MRKLREDATAASAVPTNSAAATANPSGAPIDGIGVGPRGEPGVKKKKLRDIVMNATPMTRNMGQ